jgi:hypothetical protein
MYYNARFYDPYLNQWVQPDTVVPNAGFVADYNRYSYVRNNPLRYSDPTGHEPQCEVGTSACEQEWTLWRQYEKVQNHWSSWDDFLAGYRNYQNYAASPESYYADWLTRIGLIEGDRTGASQRAALAEAYSQSVLGEIVPAFFDPNYPLEVVYQLADSGSTVTGSYPIAALTSGAIHKNSHSYVGETHVYVIRGPDGKPFKIGESAQGVRVRDGQSIRAEQQVRSLDVNLGRGFQSQILKAFPDKQSAYNYQVQLIQRFRNWYGPWTLPGNRNGR